MKLRLPSTRWLVLIIGISLFCIAFYKAYRFYKYLYRHLHLPSTEAVLGALGAAGMNWEMWTLANRKNGDSFSAVIRKLGKMQTFIPGAIGATCAHLFYDDLVTREAYEAGFEFGKKYWPLLDKEDLEEAKAK